MPDARSADAICLSPGDNVATVLRAVAAGEELLVRQGQLTSTVVAREAIKICHKISLGDLKTGAAVMKYGQPIGTASSPIARGTHVHVHNLQSRRGRPA